MQAFVYKCDDGRAIIFRERLISQPRGKQRAARTSFINGHENGRRLDGRKTATTNHKNARPNSKLSDDVKNRVQKVLECEVMEICGV